MITPKLIFLMEIVARVAIENGLYSLHEADIYRPAG